jgi:hypothetical protein
MNLSYLEWKKQVNNLFVERVCADWVDLCGDNEPLQKAHERGEAPNEFVSWWIEKYDLVVID